MADPALDEQEHYARQADEVMAWAMGEIDRPTTLLPDDTRLPSVDEQLAAATTAPQAPQAPGAPRAIPAPPAPGAKRPPRPPAGTAGEQRFRARNLQEPMGGAQPAAPEDQVAADLNEPMPPGVVAPAEEAGYRAADLQAPMGEQPAAPPLPGEPAPVRTQRIGYTQEQQPANFAQRVQKRVGEFVSARDTEEAKRRDAERARLAARATPVAEEPRAPETLVAEADVQRQQRLQELADAQDTLIANAMTLQSRRGGASRIDIQNYQGALDQYNRAQQAYNDTFRMEQQSIQGVQAAKVAAANIDANYASEYARNLQEAQQEKQRALQLALRDNDRRAKAIEGRIEQIRNKEINPMRVFQNQSTGSRLAFIFAAAANGFAQGKGVDTHFWENVNNVIDRDVDAQRAAIGNQKEMLAEDWRGLAIAKQHLTDEQAQIDGAYAAQLEATKAVAEGLKAKVSGAEQKSLLDQVIAQLERQRLDHLRGMYGAQADASLAQIRRGQGGGLRQAKEYMDLAKALGDILEQRRKGGGAGGVIPEASEESIRIAAKAYGGLRRSEKAYNELLSVIRQEGVPPFVFRMLAEGKWTTAAVPTQYVKQYGRLMQAFQSYRREVTGAQAPYVELEKIQQAFSGWSDATSEDEVIDRIQGMQQDTRGLIVGSLGWLDAPVRAEIKRRMDAAEAELPPSPIPRAPVGGGAAVQP